MAGIYKMVGSGAVTQQDMKISAVNGTTFIDLTATTFEGGLPVISGSIAVNSALMDTTTANAFIGGLDVSSYQDGNYKIRLKDSAGKVAEAWISDTAPGGETLVEKFTDGAFADAGNWIVEAGFSVAGGKAVAVAAPVNNAVYQTAVKGFAQINAGQCVKTSYDIDAITGGSVALRLDADLTTQTTTGTKTQWRTVSGNCTTGILKAVSVLSATLDNLSAQVLTDCAATGGLLLSTKGGSRGFKTLDTGFNPNLALTYEIFSANPLPLHKGYLLKVRDSSKRAIQGYVKAQGTGETFGDELLSNTTFEANIDPFVANGTVVTQSNEQAHSGTFSMKVVSSAPYANATYSPSPPHVGALALHKFTGWAYSSDRNQARVYISDNTTARSTAAPGCLTTWASFTSNYFTTKTGVGGQFGLGNEGYADGIFYFDDISYKQVLTPSATGVTITSTKGGSTFNFAALDSAFNYNDTSGYTYELWQVNNAVEVASGSIAANQMLADTTATNAHVAPVGVDLSAYQTGKYIFAAYNTVGGYAAFGYIKGTAPGGETLGAELLSDPTFDNDAVWSHTASWTIASGVATGVNGSNLTQTATISGLVGKLIKVVSTCSVYTNGTFQHYASDTYSGNISAGGVQTSYLTPVSGSALSGFRAVSPMNMVFTDLSLKQVTDCAATGALIVSAKDGATRAWASKHASFNPNLASTYKIFYVGD